jgi:hypothetical protein
MPEEDCNNCRKYDFGKGFEHVKNLVVNNKVIINATYTYEYEETCNIIILDILSTD